jgi:hypothetical protein
MTVKILKFSHSGCKIISATNPYCSSTSVVPVSLRHPSPQEVGSLKVMIAKRRRGDHGPWLFCRKLHKKRETGKDQPPETIYPWGLPAMTLGITCNHSGMLKNLHCIISTKKSLYTFLSQI